MERLPDADNTCVSAAPIFRPEAYSPRGNYILVRGLLSLDMAVAYAGLLSSSARSPFSRRHRPSSEFCGVTTGLGEGPTVGPCRPIECHDVPYPEARRGGDAFGRHPNPGQNGQCRGFLCMLSPENGIPPRKCTTTWVLHWVSRGISMGPSSISGRHCRYILTALTQREISRGR